MPELQQQLRRALEDILGELQLAQMVRVAPTLVIGLGGSRTWTARRLKRLRQIRYGQNQLVRFLFIDCDQSAFASDPALADVTDAEKVLLHIPNPEQIYRDAVNGVGEYAKMREWLPDGLNVTLLRNAKGAGGIRPVGRFALFASLNEVRQKLEGALNAILAIERELETLLQAQAERVEVEITQPRIYIVGSLCGGTGSSLFLDIAVLVRHLMRQVAPNVTPAIIGLFFLPSVFTNENFLRTNPTYLSIIRANGYAALKELEYFCDADTLKANPFTFRYPNMPDIEVNVPVYDEEFVLERGTADGRMLTTKEEVFELAARSLMADIGSPVGAQVRAANANIVTMLTSQPCPQTKKRRFIHSLGITALSAPITELLVHGTCEKLRQFVNDQVLGTVSFSADELKQTVDGFLQANKLEEQGSRNDLIERLLATNDEFLSYQLPRNREELEREAGGGEVQQAQYVANWVEAEMNRIRTQIVPEAQRRVGEQKVRVLQDAVSLARNRTYEIARQKGLRAAHQFVGELVAIFNAVKSELANEQQDYEQNRKGALENTIGNNVAFLRRLQGIIGTIRAALGRTDERAMDEALRALEEYGNGEIFSVARQGALEIIASDKPVDGQKSLLSQLQEWLQQIEQAMGKLAQLDKLCAETLSVRHQSKTTGSTYVLDQWVISPDEFSEYLQRSAFDLHTVSDALWQSLGADFDRLLQSLTQRANDELIRELATIIGKGLKDALAGQLNIDKVISEKQQREDKRQQVETLMGTMLRTCKPFWGAPEGGIGGVGYHQVFVVTVPGTQDSANYQQVEQWLRDQLTQMGVEPELVYTGYPFAIEMVVRVYGARAFWLASAIEMRHDYENKRQFPTTASLLHLDRRFLDLLPDLFEGVR